MNAIKERGTIAEVFAGLARMTTKRKTRADYMANPKTGKPVLIERYEAAERRRKDTAINKLIQNPLFGEAVAVYQARVAAAPAAVPAAEPAAVPAAAPATVILEPVEAPITRDELVPLVAEMVRQERAKAEVEGEDLKPIDLAAFIESRRTDLPIINAVPQRTTQGFVTAAPTTESGIYDRKPGESDDEYKRRMLIEVQLDKSKIPEIRAAVLRNLQGVTIAAPRAPAAASSGPDLSQMPGESSAEYINRLTERMATDFDNRMALRVAIAKARQNPISLPAAPVVRDPTGSIAPMAAPAVTLEALVPLIAEMVRQERVKAEIEDQDMAQLLAAPSSRVVLGYRPPYNVATQMQVQGPVAPMAAAPVAAAPVAVAPMAAAPTAAAPTAAAPVAAAPMAVGIPQAQQTELAQFRAAMSMTGVSDTIKLAAMLKAAGELPRRPGEPAATYNSRKRILSKYATMQGMGGVAAAKALSALNNAMGYTAIAPPVDGPAPVMTREIPMGQPDTAKVVLPNTGTSLSWSFRPPYPENKEAAKAEIASRLSRDIEKIKLGKNFLGIENGAYKKGEKGSNIAEYDFLVEMALKPYIDDPNTYSIYSDTIDRIAAQLGISAAEVIASLKLIGTEALQYTLWPRRSNATTQSKLYDVFLIALNKQKGTHPKIMDVLKLISDTDFPFANFYRRW